MLSAWTADGWCRRTSVILLKGLLPLTSTAPPAAQSEPTKRSWTSWLDYWWMPVFSVWWNWSWPTKTKKSPPLHEYKAVHRYANDNDEWGEIRFDFSAGTAQIVKLADGDMSRTNVFAKIAIRQILKLSMSELPKKLTIPFELELKKIWYGSWSLRRVFIYLLRPVGTENLSASLQDFLCQLHTNRRILFMLNPSYCVPFSPQNRLFCCRRKVSVRRGTAPFQRQRSQKV